VISQDSILCGVQFRLVVFWGYDGYGKSLFIKP
jgi:hypothetical protein